MAKVKSKWVCQTCGYEAPAYLGKCPECASWGSFVEESQVVEKIQSTHENKVFFEKSLILPWVLLINWPSFGEVTCDTFS